MTNPLSNPARTPKQTVRGLTGSSAWYGYYAGYNPQFVHDVLTGFHLRKGSTVLDPWNGMGTTTEVAKELGMRGVGFDLNPVAGLVAKARCLDASVSHSIAPLAAKILKIGTSGQETYLMEDDPLSSWFASDIALFFRRLELALQQLLVDDKQYVCISELDSIECVSSLAAFFYTALFKTVRFLLNHFRTSNPTWLRQRRAEIPHQEVSIEQVGQYFMGFASEMAAGLKKHRKTDFYDSQIDLGRSDKLRVRSKSVAAVMTSPPYCTRIDYAVTTSPELALLGLRSGKDFKDFRRKMLGTSTISSETPTANATWGSTCEGIVDRIAKHQSYAAQSYYLKTYLQYFGGLYESMAEISRVLRPGGQAAVVVQDSYFKDVHIDLARIVQEMGEDCGLYAKAFLHFPQSRSMRSINKGARVYRDRVLPVESVVKFVQEQ